MDEASLKILISNLESSRASLDSWLFVFTLLVVVGVALEVAFVIWEHLDALHDWRRGIVHPPEKPSVALLVFGLFGAGMVAVGVAGELYIGAKIGTKETSIREANDSRASLLSKLAGDAAKSAKTAHDEADSVKGIADAARADAKDALAKSQAAQSELAHAEANAARAETVASRAFGTADKAESHLAEVLKRADNLTVQLGRVTTSRSLPASPQIVAFLKQFKRTEYMFTGVCSDKECVDLLRSIDLVLERAEWKRIKSPHHFPGLVLWGDKKDDDGAGIDMEPGIKVSVESTIPDFDKTSLESLPEYIRAAIALNSTLSSNVSPPENTGRLVGAEKGTSTVVRISVGRKPLP